VPWCAEQDEGDGPAVRHVRATEEQCCVKDYQARRSSTLGGGEQGTIQDPQNAYFKRLAAPVARTPASHCGH